MKGRIRPQVNVLPHGHSFFLVPKRSALLQFARHGKAIRNPHKKLEAKQAETES